MAWTRTVGDLVTDVRLRADVQGYTARHTDAQITRYVVESLHSLAEWSTSAGSDMFLTRATGASPQESSVYGYSWLVSGSHVSSVAYKENGKWRELRRVGLSDAYRWQATGRPLYYLVEPYNPTTPGGEAKWLITLLPNNYSSVEAASTAEILVHVRKNFAVSDASSSVTVTLDTFGFEWVILDVTAKIVLRDADSSRVQLILAERDAARMKILESIRTETFAPKRRGLASSIDDEHGDPWL